jgi:hypothetical protein
MFVVAGETSWCVVSIVLSQSSINPGPPVCGEGAYGGAGEEVDMAMHSSRNVTITLDRKREKERQKTSEEPRWQNASAEGND